MSNLLLDHKKSFESGYTAITEIGEQLADTGINFGILKLTAGEKRDLTSSLESAFLLMNGKLTFYFDDKEYCAERTSIFDQDPSAVHAAANSVVRVKAETDCEISVSQVENSNEFETLFFDSSSMLESEQRGKGLLDDTSYRIVRTIFDVRNRPTAKLVLGEVVTFPGRWSSYPPHHHPQPEIYHYRFTEPQGYGYSQLGDDMLKIRENDTVKILDLDDHSQVSAPGYGMYYIWVIRHLENDPYIVPEYTEEHNWTRTEEANERVWKPKFD